MKKEVTCSSEKFGKLSDYSASREVTILLTFFVFSGGG
jgi:hypothetical protein